MRYATRGETGQKKWLGRAAGEDSCQYCPHFSWQPSSIAASQHAQQAHQACSMGAGAASPLAAAFSSAPAAGAASSAAALAALLPPPDSPFIMPANRPRSFLTAAASAALSFLSSSLKSVLLGSCEGGRSATGWMGGTCRRHGPRKGCSLLARRAAQCRCKPEDWALGSPKDVQSTKAWR